MVSICGVIVVVVGVEFALAFVVIFLVVVWVVVVWVRLVTVCVVVFCKLRVVVGVVALVNCGVVCWSVRSVKVAF